MVCPFRVAKDKWNEWTVSIAIVKCCYGNMNRQTCIHTTCPSITKFAIEVIPRKRNVEIMSKPETKIWDVLRFGMWNVHR